MSVSKPWLAVVLVPAFALVACAALPRPDVLGELQRIHSSPVAAYSKTRAADAYARAEQLRNEAELPFADGDVASAQILGERSLAAFARAHALARTAEAAEISSKGSAALAAAEVELSTVEADQARVAAETDSLELKLRVIRDAEPIHPSEKASPEREQARLLAARAFTMQARLLCGAAELLVNKAPSPALADATGALTKLEEALAKTPIGVVPLDDAARARATCLAALTEVRRASTPVSQAPGAGDALLAEISATNKFSPSRDDRGVVVTLRNVFGTGSTPTTGAAELLTDLGKIAAAHPTFPVEVVLHTDKPVGAREERGLEARAEAIVVALKKGAGNSLKTLSVLAGAATPVVDLHGKDKARNARIEVVFVTPQGF